jgi:polyphosphate kinase
MFRNLSKRVEVVTPVLAEGPKKKLWEILDILLRDRRQAWILESDGTYSQLHPEGHPQGPETLGSHQTLMNLTLLRAGA